MFVNVQVADPPATSVIVAVRVMVLPPATVPVPVGTQTMDVRSNPVDALSVTVYRPAASPVNVVEFESVGSLSSSTVKLDRPVPVVVNAKS